MCVCVCVCVEIGKMNEKIRSIEIGEQDNTIFCVLDLFSVPPSEKCGARSFLKWVQTQGRSPHASGKIQKYLRHSANGGILDARKQNRKPFLVNRKKIVARSYTPTFMRHTQRCCTYAVTRLGVNL